MSQSQSRTPLKTNGWEDVFTKHFVWFLAGYFVVQLIIRLLASPVLGTDEAEQLIISQSFELGYGSQPPLYTWLAILLFSIFGQGLFALALLKNILLFLGYLAVWLTAKKTTEKTLAVMAGVSLIFLPQIAWESQRALSHSIIMFASSAWTVYLFVRCMDKLSWGRAAVFGVIVAAGAISKFNYLFLLAAVVFAGLCVEEGRRFLRSRYILASVGVAVILLSAPAYWMFENQDLLYARVHKFGLDEDKRHFLTGIFSLLEASLLFVAVAFAIFLGTWALGRFSKASERQAQYVHLNTRRFLTLVVVFGLIIAAVSVLASGATNVKDRWMQPVLFLAPTVGVLWLFTRASLAQIRMISGSAIVLGVAVSVAIPVNFIWGSFKKPSSHSLPAQRIKTELSKYDVRSVIALSPMVAGNIKALKPDWSANVPEYSRLNISYAYPVAIIWESHSDVVPKRLATMFQQVTGRKLPAAEIHQETTHYDYWKKTPFKYSFVVIKGDN